MTCKQVNSTLLRPYARPPPNGHYRRRWSDVGCTAYVPVYGGVEDPDAQPMCTAEDPDGESMAVRPVDLGHVEEKTKVRVYPLYSAVILVCWMSYRTFLGIILSFDNDTIISHRKRFGNSITIER